jgi:hypothetical protein
MSMSFVRCLDVVMVCAAPKQDAIVNPALSWTGKVAYDNLVEITYYCMQLVDNGTWALR